MGATSEAGTVYPIKGNENKQNVGTVPKSNRKGVGRRV
jgi:hypothetical protein